MLKKNNEMERCLAFHFNKFCINFLNNWRFIHFLKSITLRGEFLRFIIYVDNEQQYMRALQGKFAKLHRA